MSAPISIDIEVTSPAIGLEIAAPAVDVTPAPSAAQVVVVATPGPPGPPGDLTIEDLDPPVDLNLLFENGLA